MLKNFQAHTVKRIIEIFKNRSENEQKRVLLSDEVGLGKTIMARAVIDEVRTLRKDVQDDDYRIVYVCSNQNIIRQNIYKLVEKSDDVFRMSQARQMLSELFAAFQAQKAEQKEE